MLNNEVEDVGPC